MSDQGSRGEKFRELLALANGGDSGAMVATGIAYRDADGVGMDLVQAARWFFSALARGNGDGIHELKFCVSRMTGEQLMTADELAGGSGNWARAAIDTWLK